MQNFIYVTKPTSSAQAVEGKLRTALEGVQTDETYVIATGGDGTLLQAIKEHLHQNVVFIGVSAGSLGLLQAISEPQIPLLAKALTDRQFEIIKAPLLMAAFCRPAGDNAKDDEVTDVIGYGFNDISIERQESRAAKFHLKVDGSSGNFVGDGVIFSTPLGSTAYSLAAGGPIIDSELQDAFVVTPNNPHLSNLHSSLYRPHVLSKSRKIRIELSGPDKTDRPLQVAIDGRVAVRNVREPLHISLSPKHINILQLEKDSFNRQIEEKRLGRL
jgi:NAD+ kinase